MRHISDKEVQFRASSLRSHHEVEESVAVHRASIGRSVEQVAAILDCSQQHVRRLLDLYASDTASGRRRAIKPLKIYKNDLRS